MTVADQPAYEMGQQAIELLIARLSDPAAEDFKEVVLPTRVVVGRSSGPPRRP
jgi:DNA-binding LacI/PurR family transcriptional regulator